MKIEFTRSGGFAAPALNRQVKIDTEELPESKAQEVKKLVDEADLPNLASAVGNTQPRPDEYHYQIVVEHEGGQRITAKTSDSQMSEALVPLVTWLSKHA